MILKENSEALSRLVTLEKAQKKSKGAERAQLEKQIAELRARNSKLLEELANLEQARRHFLGK
jgi:hypothetical protein